MSIEAMTLVLNHSKAQGRAKLVLIGIANHQGDNGAWPSIETLARYANASERSVTRDIQELEQMGELIVERNAAPVSGRYRPNLYWVNVTPQGVTDSDLGVTDSAQGVTNPSQGVTGQVLRGDNCVSVNVINRHKNLNKLPHAKREGELSEAFTEFWDIYPRKTEKLDAEKAFQKAFAEYGTEVIEGARRLARDPNLPPKKYIPYPASWLRAGGWTNEPYPERELTAEEKAARERAAIEARRAREEEDHQRKREEWERWQREVEANPPPKCEHDRIAVVCPICARQGGK
jgi:hypothetical protein